MRRGGLVVAVTGLPLVPLVSGAVVDPPNPKRHLRTSPIAPVVVLLPAGASFDLLPLATRWDGTLFAYTLAGAGSAPGADLAAPATWSVTYCSDWNFICTTWSWPAAWGGFAHLPGYWHARMNLTIHAERDLLLVASPTGDPPINPQLCPDPAPRLLNTCVRDDTPLHWW